MTTEFITTVQVLPGVDIERDIKWYREQLGMEVHFADKMYAVLFRVNLWLHLQWHADTPDDPLPGGSVVRIYVKNIQPIFEELIQRGTVTEEKFRRKTPWHTNESGFYHLNKNAIFIMKDAGE